MKKLTITKNKLLKEYNKIIREICDDLEFKSVFTGEEVCHIVHSILIKNKVNTQLTEKELYSIYDKKISSMKVTRKEWVDNYGISEIIGIIYSVLEENN